MVRTPVFDPIEYLVARRYPSWKIPIQQTFSPGQLEETKARKELREMALAYQQELQGKAPAEIEALVKAEKAAETNKYLRRQAAEESARFFNQPIANADFSHWAKLSYWTLDEAIALSFGRAPESVNWKTVQAYTNVSPFALQYMRRRELALRAKVSSELYDPVRPGFFIAWAKRLDCNIPPDLEAVVTARGEQIGDWKTAYENERAAHAKTLEWAKSNINEVMESAKQHQANAFESAKQHQAEAFEIGRQAVSERDAQIARLQEMLRAAEARSNAENTPVKVPSPEPGPRERESMLRLIIGMAIKGYTYDPGASKNRAVKEIADDLQSLGIGLDEDTVRKYLQDAKDLLPRETE